LTVAALDGEGALDPDDPAWGTVTATEVPLVPVPFDAQLNAYVRAAWTGREYGCSGPVDLTLAEQGDRLLARLSWDGSADPLGEFSDAVALFFPPAAGTAPPVTIGTRDEPVSLWLWRDRLPVQQALPSATQLVAAGPGVFRPGSANAGVSARSSRSGRRWTVVLAGPRQALAARRVGVALWDGSNDERAGIGAVSAAWTEVES
jgi:DMSO reductase family type II enzyme heme b subunit